MTRWVVLAMAGIALIIGGLWLWADPAATTVATGPDAALFVLVEPLSGQAPAPGEAHIGDVIVVSVEAEPGTFAALLYFGENDQIEVTRANGQAPLDDDADHWRIRLEVTDPPGEEQLAAIVSRAPLPKLDRALATVNWLPLGRPIRLALLRAALSRSLGPDSISLLVSKPVRTHPPPFRMVDAGTTERGLP